MSPPTRPAGHRWRPGLLCGGVGVLLLAIAPAPACEDGTRPPPPNRGSPARGSGSGPTPSPAPPQPAPQRPALGPAPSAAPSTPQGPSQNGRGEPGGAAPPATPEAAGEAQAAGAQPDDDRDLRAELHAAIADPAGCIDGDTADTLPGSLDVEVEAHVSLTGVVTRVRVDAPALPEGPRRCLAARAQAARLASPVPGAPRTVRTTLTLIRGAQ
jgi:hypothetical protein